MSRAGRVVVGCAVGAAAIALVVMVLVGVWPHLGTGRFTDPWRGLADTLTRPVTWAVPGIAGVVGAVVGTVYAITTSRRGGK